MTQTPAQKRDWYLKNREVISERRKRQRIEDPEFRERDIAAKRAHRNSNLPRIREYDRERGLCAERKLNARDRQLRKNYGITLVEWESLFAAQGCECAICGATEPGWHKGWHTDHCHESLRVRGILCANCNHGVGKFQDDPAVLRRAATYLEEHKKAPKW